MTKRARTTSNRDKRLVAVAAMVSMVAGIGVAVAPPASATAPWSVSSTPSPGPSQNGLASVSCPTTISCFAVGSYVKGSTTRALAEHWNGSHWAFMATPRPTNATLGDIACPTKSSCFAVGNHFGGATTQTLVEHWNGSHWAIMNSPNPTGSITTQLHAVLCPTTKSCFAVGTYFSGATFKVLAEHWNGRTWGIASSPSPTGSTSGLNELACPSPKSCFAVGSYRIGSVDRALAEHWNGSNWGIMKTHNPTGSTSTSLTGVACPTTKSCFAVGTSRIHSVNRSLVEHWNGSVWGIKKSRNPTGSSSTMLNGVACPTPRSCFAVGRYTTVAPSNGVKSLVEHWNGAAWGIMATPRTGASTGTALSGVTCPSPAGCFAGGTYFVGSFVTKTLVERYDAAPRS